MLESYTDTLKNAETYEEKELISNTMLQFQKESNNNQKFIIGSVVVALVVIAIVSNQN